MSVKPTFILLISLFIYFSVKTGTATLISPSTDVSPTSTHSPAFPASKGVKKRALQKSHEKPQAEKWMDAFFDRRQFFDQVPSLVNLITVVTKISLSGCTSIILYDATVEESDGLLLEQLFRYYPVPFVHGQITSNYSIKHPKMLKSTGNTCISYILFMADVMKANKVIGEQSENKVVIVSRSSQWRVYEFLASDFARVFVNLLVIQKSEKLIFSGVEASYILYTHKMYVDGIGSSEPVVICSWRGSNFTRLTDLFPMKMTDGFAGHRFLVGVAHQPPFIVKRISKNGEVIQWDGVELRLLKLLAAQYNFTTDVRESKNVDYLGSGNAVTQEIAAKRAQLGIGGVYVTPERFATVDVSHAHSYDCAAFVTLSSTAFPVYRAIFGPFHWTVWLCITLIYLFAIFPLVLSDKQTLAPLLKNPEEMENMFWYVFGTFTNCFTFSGKASWGKSEKVTTRVLVGFYWIFTIITTACYTGSIIAFVTLPVVPQTVDTTAELVKGRYQIGTLNRGGWEYWFANSTDGHATQLFKNIEYLPNVEAGLWNVTRAFFWSYAYLGSRDELDFIVRSNFTTQSKRNVLHISNNCFAPYGVAYLFPMNSIYKNTLNRGLLNAVQSGFIEKLKHDLEFDIMRSPSGKLIQAQQGGTIRLVIEDRALSVYDTQGMFLLLGAGFLLGGFFLLSEWLGGCMNFCKRRIRRLSTTSLESNPRSHDSPTPREKVGSLEYSIHTRMHSFSEGPVTTELDETTHDHHHHHHNGIAPENLIHQRNEQGIDEVDPMEQNFVENNQINEESHSSAEELAQIEANDEQNGDIDDQIDKAFNLDDMLFGEVSGTDNEDENEMKEELDFEEGQIQFTN